LEEGGRKREGRKKKASGLARGMGADKEVGVWDRKKLHKSKRD